jgi:activating signal cointegrator complex subunit 3
MEAVLLRLESERKAQHTLLNAQEVQNVTAALTFLASALQEVVTLRQMTGTASLTDTIIDDTSDDSGDSIVTASWLLNLCSTVPSELEASYLARAIWEASRLSDEAQQQAALFDALGMSEPAMAVLMEVTPVLPEIRTRIRLSDLTGRKNDANTDSFLAGATVVDLEEERRQLLLQDALDTAQIAAIARAELEAIEGTTNSGMTHTVTRKSDLQAKKYAEKAVKRAATAMKRAKEAGAIVDEADFLAVNQETLGTGGLMLSSQEEVWQLQQSLLPDGSRQYYDKRGLPHGTIWEVEDGIEKATIPAAERDESILSARLKIKDILDPASAQAFAGTTSLNPMQSTVFDVAFNSRENVLVCAPTGAGKTNVAMLTVVAHFRDVGLIGEKRKESIETGKKVVYIAPMKALAQEIVEKFSSKLKGLGLIVRELTGDMQLSRAEADSAHVIVTTPEKWDVVTRKSGTDETSLGNQCGLLIIDEVHLLADERGAVIESVVARLHRLVESRQRQVRIVGLSATLPNYEDVALFLQVSERGLFFFGPEYRPVPLQQVFIGVTVNSKDRFIREQKMNEICYDTVIDSLHRGYQVMVFVHSRKGTSDTARAMADIASEDGSLERFFNTQGKEGDSGEAHKKYADRVKKSRNREVGMHFQNGMGIHHAGMLRGDRKLTEQMFNDGAIRVLCCTATLAWGINLPAHTVVIKGTEVYNPEKGGVVDLSILDVKQIFGRAGRPQFDTSGEATLITSHDAFARYMDKLVRPVPIESNFIKQLPDHLNAEVVSGTVSNLREAATWLTYTYLYVRMLRNPLAYGINADQKNDDPTLRGRCLDLVTEAAKLLDLNKMVRFDANNSGNLSVADRGRVAANYYIQAESIASFNELLGRTPSPSDADLCRVICAATEFANMKVRQEELDELTTMLRTTCPLKIKGAGTDDGGGRLITSSEDKAFVLMQTFISKGNIKSFTLMSDKNYIASNGGRVARAIFEICLKERKAGAALKLLRIAKSIDKQIWWFQTPLRHFDGELRESVFTSLENQKFGSGGGYDTLETTLSLLDMHSKEVGQLCKMGGGGEKIQRLIRMLPRLDVTCNVQPVTSNVLKFHITVVPDFHWHTRWHGGAQSFWLWVEDGDNGRIFQYEHLHFSKRTHTESITLDLSIPLFGSVPTQYFIRVISDSWVALEMLLPVPLWDIKMPQQTTPFTDLQDLTPLPITALQEPKFEQIYSKIESFNPVRRREIFREVSTASWYSSSSSFFYKHRSKRSCFTFFITPTPLFCLAPPRVQAKQSLLSLLFFE